MLFIKIYQKFKLYIELYEYTTSPNLILNIIPNNQSFLFKTYVYTTKSTSTYENKIFLKYIKRFMFSLKIYESLELIMRTNLFLY